MLNDLLKGYKGNDYVYIIDGCLNLYVSDEPCNNDEPCPICGSYDWPYVEGLVKDIKKAVDLEDFYRIQEEKNENKVRIRYNKNSK